MEYIEANPLPEVCKDCTEPNCDVYDHGRERWFLSPDVELALKCRLLKGREDRQISFGTVSPHNGKKYAANARVQRIQYVSE